MIPDIQCSLIGVNNVLIMPTTIIHNLKFNQLDDIMAIRTCKACTYPTH